MLITALLLAPLVSVTHTLLPLRPGPQIPPSLTVPVSLRQLPRAAKGRKSLVVKDWAAGLLLTGWGTDGSEFPVFIWVRHVSEHVKRGQINFHSVDSMTTTTKSKATPMPANITNRYHLTQHTNSMCNPHQCRQPPTIFVCQSHAGDNLLAVVWWRDSDSGS